MVDYVRRWNERTEIAARKLTGWLGITSSKFHDWCRRYGSQFLAKDFKQFIRICGMTHVRTSPYYPQSNGKLERFHGSIKGECIRPGTPLSLEDAIATNVSTSGQSRWKCQRMGWSCSASSGKASASETPITLEMTLDIFSGRG